MTVRRLTAQCLPPLRNKRNSTGDCHAAEFQTPSALDAFEYASSMTLIERPAAGTPHSLNCYCDLIALFASFDWEIGRNRAKFIASRACCRPLGGALHGRQEELT
jgi:hypothetical protein